MPKTLFGMTTLVCFLLSAPFASAMQKTDTPQQQNLGHEGDVVFENLCAPDFDGFDEESILVDLDYQQLEKVRIELLERGFNPGFKPELDSESISQLTEALRLFQAEYGFPVTGQMDATTLAALSIPIQKSGPAAEGFLLRAKPSQ